MKYQTPKITRKTNSFEQRFELLSRAALTWTLWYPGFDPILVFTVWNLDIHVPVYMIKILTSQFPIIRTGNV